jgi:three-Cys-motif partner protein
VAVPEALLWQRDPHTAAKHAVLENYYDAWFPIMLRTSFVASLTVFEGYAGPGEYLGAGTDRGPEGSPMVAMRSLLERPDLVALSKPVRFVFLEDRQDRVDHLNELIRSRLGPLPAHVTAIAVKGRCETDAIGLLTSAGAWGSPIFANLDPFDAYVPLDLVQALGRNGASEAFVTFMSERLIRFASVESLTQGDTMFGTAAWRSVQSLPTADKERYLVESYRSTMATSGLDKLSGFQLLDERGKGFWLLHGTGHKKGVQKMKDAMWSVDPISGYRFRDPRPTLQQSFDFSDSWKPDLRPLKHAVSDFLEREGRVSIESVREFTLLETAYKESHASDVLKELIRDGLVGRDPKSGPYANAEVWPIAPDPPTLFEF